MTSFAPRCWVEISRRQIAANFHSFRDAVPHGVEVMPVVKADAYHHGSREVARLLIKEGAARLAVASVEEGAMLRQAGISVPILVMSDFIPDDRMALIDFQLTPVLHSLAAVHDWDVMAKRAGLPLRYHLKIDSGFGRLGTCADAAAIAGAIQAAPHTRIEGLMTHFASATDYTSGQTAEQTAYFRSVAAHLSAAGIAPHCIHMASTAGVAYGHEETWGTLVRPGLGLYGYVPPALGVAPPLSLSVKPALVWKASVLLTKDVPEGATIGYGATFRAARPTRIAVVSAGYADGIPHQLSNRGAVIADGKLAPILGAVSMDVTTIDVTESPALQAGDAVTLLGSENGITIDAQHIAEQAGGIAYSVLCGISARVRRIYL